MLNRFMAVFSINALLVTGCAYSGSVLSADSEGIQIRSGGYHDPAPMASKHCAKYGKTHKATGYVPSGRGGGIYNFSCVSAK